MQKSGHINFLSDIFHEMGRRIWLLSVLLLTFFAGCEQENIEPVLILTPNQLYLVSEPEEVLTFDIRFEGGSVEARRLRITSKVADSFTQTELDSALSGTIFYYKFEYRVPLVYEELNIYLEFLMETSSSEIMGSGRVVEVKISEKLLVETAGHEMYSMASEKHNAYNLRLGNPLHSSLADSAQMHIMDTTNSDTLLRKWLSPASSLFVRYNGFDYANATNRTVKEAFNSGLKHEFLVDILRDDIIIARLYNNTADTSYCVVNVSDVIDLPGKDSDKYVFNIKR